MNDIKPTDKVFYKEVDVVPPESLPYDQLMIGPSEYGKPIKVSLNITTEYNTGSVRDLLVDIVKAMRANLAGGTLTTDWGHRLDIEILFGNKPPARKERDATHSSDPERKQLT